MEKRQLHGVYLLAIFSILLIGSATYLNSEVSQTISDGISDGINYKASVTIYKNGEFVDHSSNLLYNLGMNMTRDLLTNPNSGNITTIALCNATAGCGTPVIQASETFSEYALCGLSAVDSAYTELQAGQGNWTISNTFTSTCDGMEINVTRLQNSSGANFAGNSFTLVTLQNSDSITLNWSISAS